MFSVCVLAASASADTYGAWQGPPISSNPTASYLGQTGLLITPTAMIAPPLEGAIYYHKLQTDPRRQAFYGATVGLPGHLEVSALRMLNVESLPSSPGVFRNETVLNAKYQIPLGKLVGNALMPKVAVGVFDVSNQVARVWYLALSRSVSLTQTNGAPINLHLGFGNKDSGDGRLDGLFGGLDYAAAPDSLLQAEYDGQNLNAGVRYFPARWISVDGAVIANDFAWGATASNIF